jgi:hypothetical protein
MRQILDGELPDPATRRSDYPRELSAIVFRALARDREQRYPSAAALVEDLDLLCAQQRWALSRTRVGELVRLVQQRGVTEHLAPTPVRRSQ